VAPADHSLRRRDDPLLGGPTRDSKKHLIVQKKQVLYYMGRNCSFIFYRGTTRVGNGISFRKNRLGMVSVIPRKKVIIPRHSEFRGRASSEARNGTEFRRKKI
jgi:hypothetical protein